MSPIAGLLAVAFSLSAGVSNVRSPEMAVIYERTTAPAFNTHFALRPIPYVCVGVQFNYTPRVGTAVGVSNLESMGIQTNFHLATLGLRVEGRLDIADHQRVIPFVVGGPLATFYKEHVGSEDISGGKPGAFIGGGVNILLTPETTWSLQPRPRLEGLYLTFEAGNRWARWASGDGLDLGGWYLFGGVEVAFQ
jgi:hypothetical protein